METFTALEPLGTFTSQDSSRKNRRGTFTTGTNHRTHFTAESSLYTKYKIHFLDGAKDHLYYNNSNKLI